MIKVGLQIPNFTYPDVAPDELFERVAAIAVTAEEAGADTVMVMDHFYQLAMMGPPELEMLEAYTELHRLGFAHSFESWRDGELVGGLYGMALGKAFFGESMFAREADASKVALVHLVERLRGADYRVIDCQQATAHLASLGAREIPRAAFVQLLRESIQYPPSGESWRTPGH